jgi:hypothetical protein
VADSLTDEDESRRREKRIQFTMNYCQHYDPDALFGIGLGGHKKATRICKAGVPYDSMEPKERPCIGGHNKPDPLAICPKWLRKTREQGEARADALEASMNQMLVVMPVVAEWRKKPPKGKAEVIECPMCKGRLHLAQSAYNGHVHGKCETEGCVSWME